MQIPLELEHTRRNIEKLENSFAETQTELKALKSRMNNAEKWISNVEDRKMEITQSGQQTENQMKKHESNIRDLWDNIKQANLHITGILEEEKQKGIENIFEEIMAENFPKCKGNRYPDRGATEGPKQVEHKQAHTKTYYNKNGKS